MCWARRPNESRSLRRVTASRKLPSTICARASAFVLFVALAEEGSLYACTLDRLYLLA
jgi:hypothetical protein